MEELEVQLSLSAFKKRMKIFHDSEDENLMRILKTSQVDVLSLVGDDAIDDERTIELIYERSRYVYYDSLEFFYDNFQEQILNLSLQYYELEEGGSNGD